MIKTTRKIASVISNQLSVIGYRLSVYCSRQKTPHLSIHNS
ncbi:hypothetical protein O53_5385 [Microcystis aeruginosa TAIHU98]|uniref:Uncharacterized protein n=1 Tax=Microcystis aeruginosa TAIHU98 TaxID=1134457 RepID=L7DZ92_MICAE|nr:hypothetical protein O53_5385 [Microcystis aeruginosa TAIHU98]